MGLGTVFVRVRWDDGRVEGGLFIYFFPGEGGKGGREGYSFCFWP